MARIGEAIRARLQQPEKCDGDRRHTPIGVIHAGITRDYAKDEDHDGCRQVGQTNNNDWLLGMKPYSRAYCCYTCQHIDDDHDQIRFSHAHTPTPLVCLLTTGLVKGCSFSPKRNRMSKGKMIHEALAAMTNASCDV